MRGHRVGGWWPQQTNHTSSSPAGVSQVDGYFSVQSLLADRACVPGSQRPPRSKANRRGRPQDVVGVPGWAGPGRAGQGRPLRGRERGLPEWLGGAREGWGQRGELSWGDAAAAGDRRPARSRHRAGWAGESPVPPASGGREPATAHLHLCPVWAARPPGPAGRCGLAGQASIHCASPRDLPPETALRSLPGACSLRHAARREMGAPRAPPRAWPGGSLVCPRGGVALVESVHVLYQRVDLPRAPRAVPPGPPTRPSPPWG